MFINNITKDIYIGSSLNLTNRMTSHFYHAKSETKGKTVINRAMNKYKLNKRVKDKKNRMQREKKSILKNKNKIVLLFF